MSRDTHATPATPEQQSLIDRWEEHLRHEFQTRDTDATLCTMLPDAYVNHVPVMTGGAGREELREFYSRYFVPQMPPDTEIVPVSRTVGADRIVDEMIFRFTHTIDMEWMLPGVPPTGKRVEIATSTGTRPRCWCSWVCWSRVSCPSPAWRPPARSAIRPCRRTSSSGAPRSPRAADATVQLRDRSRSRICVSSVTSAEGSAGAAAAAVASCLLKRFNCRTMTKIENAMMRKLMTLLMNSP
jgi:SnoaL-like domain